MMALPSLMVNVWRSPRRKEQFPNVHYRRAFLLLRPNSNLFWTRVISNANLPHFEQDAPKMRRQGLYALIKTLDAESLGGARAGFLGRQRCPGAHFTVFFRYGSRCDNGSAWPL